MLAKVLNIPAAAAPTKARARAVFSAGVLASEQGDFAAADALMMESLEIARKLGDKQGVAVSLNARAILARDQGNVAKAHCSVPGKPDAVERTGRPAGHRAGSEQSGECR